jgi:hypothetical protein
VTLPFVIIFAKVCHFDVCKLGYFSVNFRDLDCELSKVHDAKHLRFQNFWFHSQHRAYCEGTRLARAILALRNQILVSICLPVSVQNYWNGDSLNDSWFAEV